jgi:hypothetical protein
MAGEQKQELRLAIAHVLFIDIVGYSNFSPKNSRKRFSN